MSKAIVSVLAAIIGFIVTPLIMFLINKNLETPAPRPTATEVTCSLTDTTVDIVKCHDDVKKVTCYLYNGISCIPDKVLAQ